MKGRDGGGGGVECDGGGRWRLRSSTSENAARIGETAQMDNNLFVFLQSEFIVLVYFLI